jgi:arginine:ornithine antiporter/lysine permease
MEENKKGIGLLPLIGVIVSGAIGGGVFNLASDLAGGATPGGVILSWVVIGIGILMLVLCLNYLTRHKPELNGVSDYARAGFGDYVGFISGWGYWLSAWIGNVAFAVLMMTSFNYFAPGVFANENGSLTILSIVIVSVISWGLNVLVSRGVESAAVINAIVLVAKLIPLVVFIIAAIVMFKAGVFSEHFWQNVAMNDDGSFAFGAMTGDGFMSQLQSSILVMIWVFVGIEGAAMMGDRAKKKSDAGKASIISLIALLVIYALLSLLPYGVMSQADLANAAGDMPGLAIIMDQGMGLGWGGVLLSIGLIISLLGAWLSWTMLPVQATSQLADAHLLPGWFGKKNGKNAPAHALWLTAGFVQLFLIITFFVPDAYNVFVYLCTAVVMICYLLVGAYVFKLGIIENDHRVPNIIFGFLAFAFQAVFLYLSGWQYIWLSTILWAIGLALFYHAKKQAGKKFTTANWIATAVIVILAILAIIGLFLPADNWGLQGILGIAWPWLAA